MIERFSIKQKVLNLLKEEHLRLTPLNLEREICRKIPGITKRMVRQRIRELLSQGHLIYTQHYSTTHVEINYNRPVKVSPHIVLSPSTSTVEADPNCVVIKLYSGSSFGTGDHPTTRLMLRGMDYVQQKEENINKGVMRQALDIGTGTGVLAIAAAALGIEHVEGIDIDPLACHEAKSNVHLNGTQKKVQISQKTLDRFSEMQFDLVMANLRPPTIINIMSEIWRVSSLHAVWIISGCRTDEKASVLKKFPYEMLNVIWQENRNDWAAFAVKRV